MFIITMVFYATIMWMKRYNNTIDTIKFENNKIVVSTFSILWFQSKAFVIDKEHLKTDFVKFTGYESNEKSEGIELITGKEKLAIIKDFFDDYQDIKMSFVS